MWCVYSFFYTRIYNLRLNHYVESCSAVRKGANAILLNVSLVAEGIKTCFVNFDGPQDVVLGLEGTESAGSRLECFEDGEKLVMANLLYIGLFLFP